MCEGASAVKRILCRRSPIAPVSASSKSESVLIDPMWSQTAFALAVLERPLNCLTNSLKGRSRPPLRAWALWEYTRRSKSSLRYQCALVGSLGTYLNRLAGSRVGG